MVVVIKNFVNEIEFILSKIYDCNIKENLEQKTKTIIKLSSMEVSDAMDYLIILVNDKLSSNEISADVALEVFCILANFQIIGYDSLDNISNRLKWLKDMELMHLDVGLCESHKQILDTFDNLNKILNSVNIDYYHTSGILVYLLTGHPLERYHHDLDVFVNENDLEKLKSSLIGTEFEYKLFLSKRTEDTKRRTLKLESKTNQIVISVFIFNRLENGAVVVNDYYFDAENNLFKTQDYNSPRCVQLSFSDEFHFHNGIPYKAITVEALYNCKKGRGLKHLYDCNILRPYINLEKEKELDSEIVELDEPSLITDEKIKKAMMKLLRR